MLDTRLNRFAALTTQVIEHPALMAAKSMILRLVEQSSYLREPVNGVLTGAPGCGKTTVCDLVIATLHQEPVSTELGTQVQRTAIYVSVPSPVTIGAVATEILRALGDMRPESGTAAQKTARISHLLKVSGTKVILLDEFQHLFTLSTGTNLISPKVKEVQNWVKALINNSRVPIVLIGMPDCKELVNHDPQLRRRFSRHANLLDLPLRGEDGASPFHSFASSFADRSQELLMLTALPDIRKGDFGLRLFAATSGNPSQIAMFYREASSGALEHSRSEVCVNDFAVVFDENNSFTCKMGDTNPFRASIDAVVTTLRKEGDL